MASQVVGPVYIAGCAITYSLEGRHAQSQVEGKAPGDILVG